MKAHLIDNACAFTKVKVICKGQGQISRSHFSKNGSFGGISVLQTHLVSSTNVTLHVNVSMIFSVQNLARFDLTKE